MTNIVINAEKSTGSTCSPKILPFDEYLSAIESREELDAVIAKIKEQACISSDMTIYRYRHGAYRPNRLKRREIAAVIAKHSGDKTITGDSLFPKAFYIKEK